MPVRAYVRHLFVSFCHEKQENSLVLVFVFHGPTETGSVASSTAILAVAEATLGADWAVENSKHASEAKVLKKLQPGRPCYSPFPSCGRYRFGAVRRRQIKLRARGLVAAMPL